MKQMPISQYFETVLKAPLNSVRNSWGAVTESGDVYLRVWKHDYFKDSNGILCVYIMREGHEQNERLRHIEMIGKGAKCFLLMCTENKKGMSTRIKQYARSCHIGGQLHVCADGIYIEIVGYRDNG